MIFHFSRIASNITELSGVELWTTLRKSFPQMLVLSGTYHALKTKTSEILEQEKTETN